MRPPRTEGRDTPSRAASSRSDGSLLALFELAGGDERRELVGDLVDKIFWLSIA